jgi:hypothetical protein
LTPARAYESLKDLGSRLTPPPGWNCRAVIPNQDLVLTPDDGAAKITPGRPGKQLRPGGGAYSNYKP